MRRRLLLLSGLTAVSENTFRNEKTVAVKTNETLMIHLSERAERGDAELYW